MRIWHRWTACSITTQKEKLADGANATKNGGGTERPSHVAHQGLAQMHSLAQIHGILDDRIETQKQLNDVAMGSGMIR